MNKIIKDKPTSMIEKFNTAFADAQSGSYNEAKLMNQMKEYNQQTLGE